MIPSGMSTTGSAVAGDVSGTLSGVVQIPDAVLVKIVLPSGKAVYIDAAIIPGGAAWVTGKTGRFVHIRLIGRELAVGARKP